MTHNRHYQNSPNDSHSKASPSQNKEDEELSDSSDEQSPESNHEASSPRKRNRGAYEHQVRKPKFFCLILNQRLEFKYAQQQETKEKETKIFFRTSCAP